MSYPQLVFFRSPRSNNHWVLASEAVLDGAALLLTACDVPRASRSQLCLHAGIHALLSIADFLAIPHRPPESGAEILLSEEKFNEAFSHLQSVGVPMHDDRHAAWVAFRALRARYELLLAVLGRMTDAPRSDWSSWTEDTARYTPPLIRPQRSHMTPRRQSPGDDPVNQTASRLIRALVVLRGIPLGPRSDRTVKVSGWLQQPLAI